MKTLVILLVAAFTLTVADEKPLTEKERAMNECIVVAGITRETVDAAKAGNFGDETKLKKYVTCMFKMLYVNDHGEIDKDVVKAKLAGELEPPKLNSVVDGCATEHGETPEDKYLAIFKCYVNRLLEKS